MTIEGGMLPRFRNHLNDLPWLADVIKEALVGLTFNRNDTLELRKSREIARTQALEKLKSEHCPYKVLHYPEWERYSCTVCHEEKIKGAYVEICNPVTYLTVNLSTPVFHYFVQHGIPHYNELAYDLGESVSSSRTINLDIQSVIQVFKGTHIPPEILVELKQMLPQLGAAQ